MSNAICIQKIYKLGFIPKNTDFTQWVELVLNEHQLKDQELTLRIVDSAEIQALNHTYRHKNKPTNVLSFPYEDEAGIEIPLLGDIILCAPVINSEAEEQDKAPLAHWAHMVVHGTLHLLGYDHIIDAEAEEMEQLEIKLLAKIGIEDPYRTKHDER